MRGSERNYTCRELLKEAWATLGVHQATDINGGSALGLAEVVEVVEVVEARTRGQE
jgi:hypothetical protein